MNKTNCTIERHAHLDAVLDEMRESEITAATRARKIFSNFITVMRAFDILEREVAHPLHDVEIINGGEMSNRGRYKYIPLSIETFLSSIDVAKQVIDLYFPVGKQVRKKKFLDVGCGIGTKLLLAGSQFETFGLEINSKYAEMARQLVDIGYSTCDCKDDKDCGFRHAKTHIFEGDALKFNRYDEFDVIYFYRPFQDDRKQRRLEAQIIEQAKEGAVVLAFMSSIFGWDMKLAHFKPITNNVFVKTTEETVAKRIREAL